MSWRCFSTARTGAFIQGRRRNGCGKMLLKSCGNLLPSARKLTMRFTFQHDTGHIAKLATLWLKEKKVNVFAWPTQRPDLFKSVEWLEYCSPPTVTIKFDCFRLQSNNMWIFYRSYSFLQHSIPFTCIVLYLSDALKLRYTSNICEVNWSESLSFWMHIWRPPFALIYLLLGKTFLTAWVPLSTTIQGYSGSMSQV